MDLGVIVPDEPTLVKAASLSREHVKKQLFQRGQKPSGIHNDDVKTLQRAFDNEYRQAVDAREAALEEQREKLSRNFAELREQQLIVRRDKEEKLAVENDSRLEATLSLIEKNETESTVNIQLEPPSARMLSQVLGGCTSIVNLDLSGSSMGDEAGSEIARILLQNDSIESLDLSFSGVGPQTANVIGQVIEASSSLKYVSLEGNDLSGGSRQGSEGFRRIASALGKNSTLGAINLARTNLGDEDGKSLAEAIVGKNTTLRALDIKFNPGIKTNERTQLAAQISTNRAMHKEEEKVRDEAQAEEREMQRNQRKLDAIRQKEEAFQEELKIRSEQRQKKREAEHKEAKEKRAADLEAARERAYERQFEFAEKLEKAKAKAAKKKKKK